MTDIAELMREPANVRRAELRTYSAPTDVVAIGPSALARVMCGLSPAVPAMQSYLHVATADGIEAWCGPFVSGCGVTVGTLNRAWSMLHSQVSISEAVATLSVIRREMPATCAAVDLILWDIVCRRIARPLWRVLGGDATRSVMPPFYASVLGIDLAHAAELLDILEPSYAITKWSMRSNEDAALQLQRLASRATPWESIALDIHGRWDLRQVRAMRGLAPGLAWLEDPFPECDDAAWQSADDAGATQLPRLVTGENVEDPERLIELSGHHCVHAVNVEIERLGVTGALTVLLALRERKKTCLLHGRAAVPSMHLAAAFSETVRWIEHHVVYAPERLATICGNPAFEPQCIAGTRLFHAGLGTEPDAHCSLGASEVVFDMISSQLAGTESHVRRRPKNT